METHLNVITVKLTSVADPTPSLEIWHLIQMGARYCVLGSQTRVDCQSRSLGSIVEQKDLGV